MARRGTVTPLEPKRSELTQPIAVTETRNGIRFRDRDVRTTFNRDDLVGRRGLGIYEKMRTDDQVKAALGLKKAAIIGPGWALEPASDDARDVEFATELTTDLDALPTALDQVLLEILTALDFGFSITEQIYRLDSGTVVLDRLQPIAPHGITFEQDSSGCVIALHQQYGQSEAMPPGKFIHMVNAQEFANPYGVSDLRAAYRAWWHKVNWIQWLAIYGEKLADAPVVVEHPQGASDTAINNALTVAENLQARTAIRKPEGWDISLLESGRDPKAVFLDVIDRYDLSIAKALLLPDKLGLAGGEVQAGSLALSKTQLGAFFFVIDQQRRLLRGCFQRQCIDRMAAFRNPQLDPPMFKLLPLTDDDQQGIVAAWNQAVTGGVPQTPRDWQHTRQLLGYPEMTDDEIAEELERQEANRDAFAQNIRGGDDDADDDDTPDDDDDDDGLNLAAFGRAAGHRPFWRAPRETEARLNMTARLTDFERNADALGGVLGDMATVFADELRTMVQKQLAKGELTPEWVRDLTLRKTVRKKQQRIVVPLLQRALQDGVESSRDDLIAARADGREMFVRLSHDLTADLQLADGSPGLIRSIAERFFSAKSFWITGVLEDTILSRARAVLFNALKGDKPDRVIMLELDDALGDMLPTRDAGGRAVNVPHRLETIARTNTAEAVNEGRFRMFTQPDVAEFVPLLEYSAILDSRVRAAHAAWDGVRKPAAWWLGPPDRRPPAGFNCRCILVPVTITDTGEATPDGALPSVAFPDPGFR